MQKENPAKKPLDERQKEARQILDRVARESETVATSSMARTAEKMRTHFSGMENPEDDHIEILGKRIGRALSLLALVALAVYLFLTYVAK